MPDKPFRICRRVLNYLELMTDGWLDINIKSASDPKTYYQVQLSHHGKSYAVCDCTGYQFRLHCSHIDKAYKQYFCDWSEWDEPPNQGRCPKCGDDIITI